MNKVRISFKNKVLIPTIIIFILSIFVISANNYKSLELSVITETNSVLNIFTNEILMHVNQLDMILETTENALNDQNMAIARAVAHILNQEGADTSTKTLQDLCRTLGLLEINIADAEGLVIYSNFDEYLGFDYKSSEHTQKYMALANGTMTELQEKPRKSMSDAESIDLFCHYTGIARKGGGFIQIGCDAKALLQLQDEINIEMIIEETTLGESGYGVVLLDGVIRAHPDRSMFGRNVSDDEWYESVNAGAGFAWIDIDGVRYYAGYKNSAGYTVIGMIPEAEYLKEIKQAFINTVLFIVVALIVMIIVIYAIMGRLLKPVKNVTESLGKIAEGDFTARIEGDYNDEFALIKDAVNDMAMSISSHLNDKLQAERQAHEAELAKLDLWTKVHYDALTNIFNRRYLDEHLGRIMKSLSRMGGTISVLMADIDCFKQFNDTYGHSVGDECLKAVANALNDSAKREDDFVARYGGEEFIIVLPNTDENGARILADRILDNIRALNIKHENSKVADYVTISIGVTTGEIEYTQSSDDYINRADEALYMSKQNGRDRYTFLPISPIPEADENSL